MLRGLQGGADDDGDRLAVEEDLVVLEDPQPPALRVVRSGVVAVRQLRRVAVVDHPQYAGVLLGGTRVDGGDAARADARVDDDRVQDTLDVVFGGVQGLAGDLQPPVHSGQRGADGGLGLGTHFAPPTTRS